MTSFTGIEFNVIGTFSESTSLVSNSESGIQVHVQVQV